MEKGKCICFAYFGDGKFLGWYANSFGSIRKSSPKIYNSSDKQLETITKNFNHKMDKLADDTNLAKSDPVFALIDKSIDSDSKLLYPRKEVKLKIVECPEYDGPNPDFDKDAYTKLVEEYHVKLASTGDGKWFKEEPFGAERLRLLAEAKAIYGDGPPRPNNWIYADYNKVKEWASTEPTEFLGEILRENK